MSKLYPEFSEDELIIDEEEEVIVDHTFYDSPSSSTRRKKSPGRSRSSLRPLSKYDHRPRNVEFNGNNFVATHRQGGAGAGGGNVSISEYESRVRWTDDIEDHMPEVRGRGRKRRKPRETDDWSRHCRAAKKWLLKARKWKVIVLGCLLGLLVGFGYRGIVRRGQEQDNLLKCPSDEFDKPCLTPSQIKIALLHLEPLKAQLHTKAGQFECGEKAGKSKGIAIEELRRALPEEPDVGGDRVCSMLSLIIYNPHWNIVWLEEDGTVVTDWLRRPPSLDRLESTSPAYPLKCRVSIYLSKIWSTVKIALLVLVAMTILLLVGKWKEQKEKMGERNKFLMVDKIVSVLRQHYETVQKTRDLLPYLAIVHVRDMLISPSERDRKLKVWEEACSWIAKYESRVRVERQRISGEDFEVWKWIQEDPPHTEEPVSLNRPGPSGGVPHSSMAQARKHNWYNGTTFDDDAGRNTGRNNRINSPYGSPSPCIRLKNMFETIKHMKDDLSREIEDSVLDRCIPHGGVVHIYVDRRSTYGCVYLKMDSLESAVNAYKALHGGWYKGKLVTAKYIPLDKYHKWFSAAASAKKPIYPSS